MSKLFFSYMWGKLSVQETDGAEPAKGAWEVVDESTLTPVQQGLLAEYRSARKLATESKAAFESSVRGVLGFAVEKKAKAKATPKSAKSLADWIVERRSNGGAV